MDARTGKKVRVGRLFDTSTGRSLIVAYSHGSFIGPLPGIETAASVVRTAEQLVGAEGLLVSPGLVGHLEHVFVGRSAPSLVVHLDWMNFTREVLLPDRLAVAAMATVEQSAAAGADAVMTFLYYGDPDLEAREVAKVAQVARECERLGLALIVEPRSAREQFRVEDESNLSILTAFCRMSAEIGADIVKAVWRGPSDRLDVLRSVVEATPVPVFLAGGAYRPDFREVLTATEQARSVGMLGLVYGRNIFQSPAPEAALKAIRAVFHDGALVDDALAAHSAVVRQDTRDTRDGSSSRY